MFSALDVKKSICVTAISMTMERCSLIVRSYSWLSGSEICFQMQVLSRNTRLVFDINKQGKTRAKVFIKNIYRIFFFFFWIPMITVKEFFLLKFENLFLINASYKNVTPISPYQFSWLDRSFITRAWLLSVCFLSLGTMHYKYLLIL